MINGEADVTNGKPAVKFVSAIVPFKRTDQANANGFLSLAPTQANIPVHYFSAILGLLKKLH
jgi:hypothetical protein